MNYEPTIVPMNWQEIENEFEAKNREAKELIATIKLQMVNVAIELDEIDKEIQDEMAIILED